MSSRILNGACLCEGIRYAVKGEPEKVFVCYCSDCSRSAGAPYQMMAKYSRDDLNILQGENLMKIWVVKETVSGKEKNKVFCSNCGCTLWTIPMNHGGEKFIIRTALLNDRDEPLEPEAEYFSKMRPGFLGPINGAKSFETMAI